MKTASYHVSNFGNMVTLPVTSDSEGYVTYHVSPRYAAADNAQLHDWNEHGRTEAVRNAAGTEIGGRGLQKWRERGL